MNDQNSKKLIDLKSLEVNFIKVIIFGIIKEMFYTDCENCVSGYITLTFFIYIK